MNRRYYRQYDDFGENTDSEALASVEKELPVLTGIPETAETLERPSFVQLKEQKEPIEQAKISSNDVHKTSSSIGDLFNLIETEDIILIAMIVLLLMEPEQDTVMILILSFLFLSKFI